MAIEVYYKWTRCNMAHSCEADCLLWADGKYQAHLMYRPGLSTFNERSPFIVDLEVFGPLTFGTVIHKERAVATARAAMNMRDLWLHAMLDWTSEEWRELAKFCSSKKGGRI